MTRVRLLSAMALFALAACAAPVPDPAAATWIMVTGPMPPVAMSLETDGSAWSITPNGGGGVVSEQLTEGAEVRLIGLAGCRIYARFDVAPGSAHVIRFAADGSVGIENATGGAMELGPALGEAQPSNC